jgi:O-antigen/teichoic acid export membrane protein
MRTQRKLLRTFLGKEETDRLRYRFARAATGTIGLKIAFAGLSMASSLILARVLGVGGYGTYTYTMAWINFLSVPAQFGLDRLLVRNIATYQTQSAWGLMRGLLRWSDLVVLLFSLGIALLMVGVTWGLGERLHMQAFSALWVLPCILPLLALLGVKSAALQGLHYVVASRMSEFLLRPLAFLVCIGVAYILLGTELSPEWAVVMNAVSVGASLLIVIHLLRHKLPQPIKESVPTYQTSTWVHSALPMILISGMNVINHRVDTLMLGAMASAEAVGIYNVAFRGAQLIVFIQMAVNAVLMPTVASLYASGNMPQLQRVITTCSRVVLLVSLSSAIILVVFGDSFLSLFGAEFQQGYTTLFILSIGMTLNAASGSVGVILLMTGYERYTAVSVGASAGLSILLNAVFIPLWGVEGAALATATTMVVRNVAQALWVYKKLHIHSTALGNVHWYRKASHLP